MTEMQGGKFWIGCSIMSLACGGAYESPIHEVQLSAYAMDLYETTNEQFAGFLSAHGNDCGEQECLVDDGPHVRVLFDGQTWKTQAGFDQHPVLDVTWFGADAYCKSVGKRLCTEAEWESGCKGHEPISYPWGNSGPVTCDLAVLDIGGDGCGTGETFPVGSKPAGVSPVGAHDLIGNAAEWVFDWYFASYYEFGIDIDPVCELDASGQRVLRGGSFMTPIPEGAGFIHCFNRRSAKPDEGESPYIPAAFGVRCCKSME